MSKPLWFHKTKSNRIILLGPKQEDAAGGCREREGRPCAREDAAEVSRAQIPAFSLTGSCRGRCVRLRHQRLNVRPMAQCLNSGQ